MILTSASRSNDLDLRLVVFVGEHNVLGLEVAVDQIVLVHIREPAKHLANDDPGVGLTERLGRLLKQLLEQVAPGAKFHDLVEHVE